MPPSHAVAATALAVATLVAAAAAAQAPDPARPFSQLRLQSWDDAAGLPSNSVQDIAQTADGYLWLATEQGLARFDGARFTVYSRRSSPSIPSEYVRALQPMPDGSLWVGLEGSGLVHVTGRVIASDSVRRLSDDHVVAIARARAGGLWVGTAGGGLNHVGSTVRVIDRARGLPHDHVTAVLEDASGRVWIGTPEGLAQLDAAGRVAVVPGLAGRAVTALLQLRDGRIAVGTSEGVHVLRNGAVERVPAVAAVHVRALLLDSRGTLWIGTNGDGLLRLVDGSVTRLTTAQGLSSNVVGALAEDREGGIWVGTMGGGVQRISQAPVTMIGAPEGLPNDVALAVRQDSDGAMRVGTAGGGLARVMDGRVVSTLRQGDGLSHGVILSTAEGADGSLWIGTPRGLDRVYRGRITSYGARHGLPGTAILVTFADPQGRLWLGTNGDGLVRWNDGVALQLRRSDGLPSDIINAVSAGGPGELWVGTRAGLARVRDGRVDRGSVALQDHDVMALMRDTAGTLWVGTGDGTLVRIDAQGMRMATQADGLFDSSIYAIVEDGHGALWLSGPKGVSRILKRDLEAYMTAAVRGQPLQPRVFGPPDGMRSRETNGGVFPAVWRAADGSLWFPTVRGVAVFDPSAATRAVPAPSVIIERVAAGDSIMAHGDTVRLGTALRAFSVDFTAVSFSATQQLRFRYMLQGLDTAWVDADTDHRARYTRVPPGQYTFRVAARTADGVWHESAHAVPIIVDARLTESGLIRVVAGLIALLAAGAAGTAFNRRRVAHLRQRERELVALVADRTRAERRYRDLFENATDAVFTCDEQGGIATVNHRFASLAGVPAQDLIGRRLQEVLGDEPRGDAVPLVLENGCENRPMQMMTADGTGALLEASIRAIDVPGEAVVFLGIARDVTERRQLEQRMLQAQRMESLGQFAGGVAHDFNNVLVAINAYGELLLDDLPQESGARTDVAEILQASERAAGLTRQLLAFSRQQVLQPRTLSVNEVVMSLHQMLGRLVREDVSLALELSPDAGAVRADQGQLEQVVLNLVVNARDAMPDGGSITIETAAFEVVPGSIPTGLPAGRYALLKVRDSGTGIPPEVQSRVFEPFFTTKELGKGTGLGLATVLGIVQQSGGHVTCESALGKGTTFSVYLPSTAAAAPEPSAVERPAAGGSETILLVEDEDAVRATTARLLERRGYRVVQAAGGDAALALCAAGLALDLVVSDMIMPAMSGHELAARIRPMYPSAKVMLMSGYSRDVLVRPEVLAGVDAFLEKPFSGEALCAKVREVLDRERVALADPG